MIACVAVVGSANDPLFLQSFNSQTELERFHFVVHSALDVVEERLRIGVLVPYLGILFPIEDYKVYGYITNTNTKFIIVTDDTDMKDVDVKTFFDRLHQLYVKATCNPFHTVGEPVESSRFKVEVARLVAMSS
eukprot:TRINITY_DN13516_c0_g1_i1.p2 TRINITY_DN13516_c0_g1~~TRINITY_DN13516_c0_g1_i1.p2  ORF type:complete len:144 (+),score=47.31 TRINITY_DN13516_c0_g1_i1:35-433(+)